MDLGRPARGQAAPQANPVPDNGRPRVAAPVANLPASRALPPATPVMASPMPAAATTTPVAAQPVPAAVNRDDHALFRILMGGTIFRARPRLATLGTHAHIILVEM